MKWWPTQDTWFWSQVRRMQSGCWHWMGKFYEKGNAKDYGITSMPDDVQKEFGCRKKISVPAHRMSWSLVNGRRLPVGFVVRHSCHNKSCVRPLHLLKGTHHDNYMDSVRVGILVRPGLRPWIVAAIVRKFNAGKSGKRIAAELEISRPAVSRVARRIARTQQNDSFRHV